MQDFRKEALVTVRGLMNNEGLDDGIEISTRGICYRKNDTYYVLYEEEDPENRLPVRNAVRISSSHVDVKKRGFIEADLSFEQGCKLKSTYSTPYGRMEIGVFTEQMDLSSSESGLKLELAYRLEINNQHVSENRLFLHALYGTGQAQP